MGRKRIKQQYGALPFRWSENGQVEVLLVTSRDTGRWVIPKGWPMKGKKAHVAAAQEAWEEAGVLGKIAKKPIGRFQYDKVLPSGDLLPCSVSVFPLAVETMHSIWPEFGQRTRSWMAPDSAAAVVNEKALGKIIASFGAAALVAASNAFKSAA